MMRVQRSMSWICSRTHLVIFIWATLRLTHSEMSSLVTGFSAALTSCTQSVGMPSVYLQRMPQLSATKILVFGPMKTLQHRRHRCDVMHVPSTGIVYLTHVILSTTSGTNGSLSNFTSAGWLTVKILPSTGVQDAKLF